MNAITAEKLKNLRSVTAIACEEIGLYDIHPYLAVKIDHVVETRIKSFCDSSNKTRPNMAQTTDGSWWQLSSISWS